MNRITELEKKYVNEVLDTQFRSSSGAKFMMRFEQTFAEKIGSKFAVSCVNGTATIHATLEAMGIKEGDEVILPPLTMSATTFAVLQANATPVFADVDLDTFQISASSISSRITENTKAIITVALYGLSPDMDEINFIAKRHNLKVIEDNAECFLGKYKGKTVGSLGDAASFSFQSSKHLTSGEGGIVTTDDEELATSIRRVNSLGYAGVGSNKAKITKLDIQDPNYSRHIQMGWNYRMPELCCAVALAQTERMEELVQARVDVANLFSSAVKDYSRWFVEQFTPEGYINSYWAWVAKLEREDLTWWEVRDTLIKNGSDGIYSAWKLTYQEPMFQKMRLLNRERYISEKNRNMYDAGLCSNAEHLQRRLFQFKTNYWDIEQAKQQAEILHKSLKIFN